MNLREQAYLIIQKMQKWADIAGEMPEGDYFASSGSSFLLNLPYNLADAKAIIARLEAIGFRRVLSPEAYNEHGITVHAGQSDYDALSMQLGDDEEMVLTIFFEITLPGSDVTKRKVYYTGIVPKNDMALSHYETVYPELAL